MIPILLLFISIISDFAALSSSLISSLLRITNLLESLSESKDINSISTSVPASPRIRSTTSSILQPTTSLYSEEPTCLIFVILSSGLILPDFSAGPPGTKLIIFV